MIINYESNISQYSGCRYMNSLAWTVMSLELDNYNYFLICPFKPDSDNWTTWVPYAQCFPSGIMQFLNQHTSRYQKRSKHFVCTQLPGSSMFCIGWQPDYYHGHPLVWFGYSVLLAIYIGHMY